MILHRPAVLILLCAGAMLAQTDRGTITGTLTDPAGAVVTGVLLQARNTDTGAVFEAASTLTGNYTLSQIPAGNYELSATATGFKRYIRSGITVPVAQTLRLDVALEVGSATESITVMEQAPLLKTESGEISHNIETERLDNLPVLPIGAGLGIRNPYNMITLLPGSDFRPEGSVRINGLPGNTQSLRVEGQDSTNLTWQQTTQIVQQSVDAIQEVAIQTSNFAAEYGQAGSAVFNMTMKSGTNRLHGSGYEYLVNDALNARPPFVATRPTARRNDFGFSLGGPVYIPKVYDGHDKFFFFFNFEQYRDNIGTVGISTVPTAAMKAGDFSSLLGTVSIGSDALGRPVYQNEIFDPTTDRLAPNGQRVRDQYPNNIIPSSVALHPVALKIQNFFPVANLPGSVNNYRYSFTNPRFSLPLARTL